MTHYSLAAGSDMPKMAVSKVGGGEIHLGSAQGWQVIVIYRGKHCPICRTYLKTLNALLDQFAEIGVEVAAISADTAEKAETEAKEEGWLFPGWAQPDARPDAGLGTLCLRATLGSRNRSSVSGAGPSGHQFRRQNSDHRYLECAVCTPRS